MKNVFLLVFIISFCFSQILNVQNFEKGKRGSQYRIWVYFKDKVESSHIEVAPKTHERRLKHSTKNNFDWYDLKVSSNYIKAIKDLGLNIENESRWLNAISITCTESYIDTILSFSFVRKVEPVIGFKKKLFELKNNDPESRDFDYGEGLSQIAQINIHELHNQGFTGEGVRVLILDTGFDLSHNAFSHLNVVAQRDFINNDDQTANQSENEHNINQDSHGTAILSIIGSYAPENLIGSAFNAEFLLAKTEDVSQEWEQEEDDYVAGLEWGEANGAEISSSSLGYADWYEQADFDGNTAITTNAIDIAVSLGVVCVTAVGNGYMVAPADADSVISVGAVHDNGVIASFSTRGPTADGRIKPEVCAQGVGVRITSANNNSQFANIYSGTSASTPLVAGGAALIKQARPSWSPMQIREAIMMSASMADNINNDYGYGIMNASAAVNYWVESGNGYENQEPNNFGILKTYPNPFNPSLNIDISLHDQSLDKIEIFSYNGEFINTIWEKKYDISVMNFKWHPQSLSNGVYFIRLKLSNDQTKMQKVTYIK